jgi:hypothetical protein
VPEEQPAITSTATHNIEVRMFIGVRSLQKVAPPA